MRSKTIRAGDEEGLSDREVVEKALGALIGEERRMWVTFEKAQSQNVIEVAVEPHHVLVSIPHKEPDGMLPLLKSRDVQIPNSWAVTKDKRKKLWSSGFLEMKVDRSHSGDVVDFIELIAQRIFKWPEQIPLKATLQG